MGPAVLSCIWTPRKKEFPPIYSKHVHPSKCCQGKEMFLLLVKADWSRSCMYWLSIYKTSHSKTQYRV